MNLTDKRDVKKLLAWAAENEGKYLTDNDKEKESFWKIREQENTYMMPYGFKTIQEFEKIYNSILGKEADREIERIVAIAAFSSRTDYERSHAERESAMEKMPEHIYVF